MVTMGPINDVALQGSSFKLQDNTQAREARRCAFVRISFLRQGSAEELTYPRDQCASWFVGTRFGSCICQLLDIRLTCAGPHEQTKADSGNPGERQGT